MPWGIFTASCKCFLWWGGGGLGCGWGGDGVTALKWSNCITVLFYKDYSGSTTDRLRNWAWRKGNPLRRYCSNPGKTAGSLIWQWQCKGGEGSDEEGVWGQKLLDMTGVGGGVGKKDSGMTPGYSSGWLAVLMPFTEATMCRSGDVCGEAVPLRLGRHLERELRNRQVEKSSRSQTGLGIGRGSKINPGPRADCSFSNLINFYFRIVL